MSCNQTLINGSTTLAYDPLDRLYRLNAGGGADRTFGYDGDHMVTEFDAASGAIQARYIFGPGDDEPIVWYPGSGTATRYFLEQDERGSVARITDGSGGLYAIDSYDEYGNPGAGTSSRFQYTGQMTLAGTANLLYYKARVYNPALGRFMQTDPIGYAGGMNLYDYVGSDPVNLTDPGGLDAQCGFGKRAVYKDRQDTTAPSDGSILVTGHFLCEPDPTVLPVAPPITVQTGEDSAGSSSMPQKAIVTHIVPKNALTCLSGGFFFNAPPSFNPSEIAAAGKAGGLSNAGRAVAQFGAYDFQRTTNSAGQQVNVTAYVDASNFAVGLYLGGAGYSDFSASAISDTYALFNSGNGSTLQQAAFRSAGINAANGTPVVCVPPQ